MIPFGPLVEVEARPEEVVAVPGDVVDDLAEAERHDRQVVAAQAQCRQADQDPEQRSDGAGERQQDPDRRVDSREMRIDAHGPDMPGDVRELLGREPGAAVYAPIA